MFSTWTTELNIFPFILAVARHTSVRTLRTVLRARRRTCLLTVLFVVVSNALELITRATRFLKARGALPWTLARGHLVSRRAPAIILRGVARPKQHEDNLVRHGVRRHITITVPFVSYLDINHSGSPHGGARTTYTPALSLLRLLCDAHVAGGALLLLCMFAICCGQQATRARCRVTCALVHAYAQIASRATFWHNVPYYDMQRPTSKT